MTVLVVLLCVSIPVQLYRAVSSWALRAAERDTARRLAQLYQALASHPGMFETRYLHPCKCGHALVHANTGLVCGRTLHTYQRCQPEACHQVVTPMSPPRV